MVDVSLIALALSLSAIALSMWSARRSYKLGWKHGFRRGVDDTFKSITAEQLARADKGEENHPGDGEQH